MPDRHRDKMLYELQAEVIQAVAHPLRLAIVDFLCDGEQCVCDIAEAVEAERSNVSRHLGLMLRAGVVDQRKDGLKMIYSLKAPCILNFIGCLNGMLRDRLEAQAKLHDMLSPALGQKEAIR